MNPNASGIGFGDLRQLEAIMPLATAVLGIWFTSMALTGWLAARRGRGDGLWTVIATFIGPIALLAILVLPPRERSAEPEGMVGVRAATSAPDWPDLPPPPAPISLSERLLGASAGAGLGALGAGILAWSGQVDAPAAIALVSVVAGAMVGWWLAGSLIEADRNKVLAMGLAAGVLVISAAALVTALVNAIPGVLEDPINIAFLPAVLFGVVLYPLVTPIVAPGLLAVTLPGGVLWAVGSRLLIRLARERSGPSGESPKAAAAS